MTLQWKQENQNIVDNEKIKTELSQKIDLVPSSRLRFETGRKTPKDGIRTFPRRVENIAKDTKNIKSIADEDSLEQTIACARKLYTPQRGASDSVTACINDVKNNLMKSEIHRYGSFYTFPQSPAWPHKLATAGFYYQGRGDQVICFSCHVTYQNWKHSDSPMEVHQRISPNCRFLNGIEDDTPIILTSDAIDRLHYLSGVHSDMHVGTETVNNINESGPPVSQSTAQYAVSSINETRPDSLLMESNPAQAVVSCDQHSRSQSQFRHSLGLVQGATGHVSSTEEAVNDTSTTSGAGQGCAQTQTQTYSQLKSTEVIGQDCFGINIDRPRHTEYAITASRIFSFNGWPLSNTQKPSELAEAGFYYIGIGDGVRCFFCAGGLRNWEPEDNAWIEHARWFPRCVYLRQIKGPDFVRMVQEMNANQEQIEYNQVMAIVTDMRVALQQQSHPSLEQSQAHLPLSTTITENKQFSSESASNGSNEANSVTASSSQPALDLHDKDVQSLMEENERLKQQKVCKICLDNDSCIVFLPCGHLCCCAECAPALRKCPMCRTDIRGSVRTFLG